MRFCVSAGLDFAALCLLGEGLGRAGEGPCAGQHAEPVGRLGEVSSSGLL